MGKNKGGGKSSGSGGGSGGGKKEVGLKKCLCEDLYKCMCGNRPERPSRGHKWYPEEQKWGGKGHKQKGASGQIASTQVAAKTTSIGKTVIASWQTLPSQLLVQQLKKLKRPTAKYIPKQSQQSLLFKYQVICPDAKGKPEHDLKFVPGQPVPNQEQAKEEAALLALFYFTPKIPQERKLPEPYKTTWLHMIQQQSTTTNTSNLSAKQSSNTTTTTTTTIQDGATASTNLVMENKFVSYAEKQQKMKEKKQAQMAKQRYREQIETANRDHTVFLSPQMRKQIETLLRMDSNSLTEKLDNDDNHGDDSMMQQAIVNRLIQLGFTKSQSINAFVQINNKNKNNEYNNHTSVDEDYYYNQALQWLCIHLNEEDLPDGVDPRERTLDVIVAPNTKNSGKTTKIVKELGVTKDEALALVNHSTEKTVKELFLSTIQTAVSFQNHTIIIEEELIKEEFEALNAIFLPNELTIVEKEDGCEIALIVDQDWKLDFTISFNNDQKNNFQVWVGNNTDNGWPKPGSGTALHYELYKFILEQTPPSTTPSVFSIYTHVQELLQQQQDGENELLQWSENTCSLLPYLLDSSHQQSKKEDYPKQNSENSDNNKNKRKNEPSSTKRSARQRQSKQRPPSFWTVLPENVIDDDSIPSNNDMMKIRQRLPAYRAQTEFLTKMNEAKGRVMLVTGETGCGKTTQIPQFILDDAKSTTKVIVAQPRRLAATGVANRVANERGQPTTGGEVGYVVRGDSSCSTKTKLLFCTTGVLLRQLQQEDNPLKAITHIVVDEVHERHLDTDILLGILKVMLKKVKHLRVVLMSATMDADRFARYWGTQTPRMHIPGFTHPVKDYTLEDVLSMTGYIPPKKAKKHFRRFGNNSGGQNYKSLRKSSPWADSELSDKEEEVIAIQEETKEKLEISSPAKPSNNNNNNVPPMEELLKRINDSIDYDLIGILVNHIIANKARDDDGSILVFLPGAGEIAQAERSVRQIYKGFNDKIMILPLHGGLQPRDQQRVFSTPPNGTTKLILATNVAETSITIPDCTIVIDTGREKQSSYDPSNRMPMLIEKLASKDNLKQRRGRAGRVRPGTCYKLISKQTLNNLPLHGEPEIKRCALEQALLSLLFLGVESGDGNFLNTLLDPPKQSSIDAAIYCLTKIGAVSTTRNDKEKKSLTLTSLGMHLAGIPAPPVVGKLLVMGSLLGCRSAALSIAACMSVGRSPFLSIGNNHNDGNGDSDERILKQREELFQQVGNSDHAMFCAVYEKWDALNSGGGSKKKFCQIYGLSFVTMRDVKQLVHQLDSALCSIGFVERNESNINATSWRIIRSLVVSSLAPTHLVRVQRPSQKYTETMEGAIEKDGVAKEYKFFTRSNENDHNNKSEQQQQQFRNHYHGISEERVFLHPSSAMFAVGTYNCPWIVYNDLVRTSKPFLRDATECSSYSLLLFGGKLSVQIADECIIVDDYVRLSANARIGALIGGLRDKIDDLLTEKVQNPTVDISSRTEMKLIIKLLLNDGLAV